MSYKNLTHPDVELLDHQKHHVIYEHRTIESRIARHVLMTIAMWASITIGFILGALGYTAFVFWLGYVHGLMRHC